MISTETATTNACASSGGGPKTAQMTQPRSRSGRPPARTRPTLGRRAAGRALGTVVLARPCARSARATCRRRRARPASRGCRCRSSFRPTTRIRFLTHGIRLAGEHRFVDVTRSVDDQAVDGDFLAGPHAQAIADLHVLERDVLSEPSDRSDAPSSARAVAARESRPTSARAPAARALARAERASR